MNTWTAIVDSTCRVVRLRHQVDWGRRMHGRNYLMVRKAEKRSEHQAFTPFHLIRSVDVELRIREKLDAEADTPLPLPKASYSVLKDKQIRDLLAVQELPTAGDRSQLIARHERSVRYFSLHRWNKPIIPSRWVTLYNANLDRSPALRKRSADLRVEMRRWEEDRRVLKKEPLKTDIAEYRVRAFVFLLIRLMIEVTAVACQQSRV